MHHLALRLLGVLSILAMIPGPLHALITGGEGNEPVENRGWPAGSEAVANLETRLAHWEGPSFGGGQTTFEFREESTANFNKALARFAKIDAPKKELILQGGPKESFWLGISARNDPDIDARIDWSFVVWNAESWKRLYNNPESTFFSDHPNFRKPVDPPKIFLFLGGGSIAWDEVVVPDGVTVIDERVKEGEGPGVTGTVTDIESGKPLAGAKVSLLQASDAVKWPLPVAATVADGRFVLKGFPIGTYAVVASHQGYASKRSLAYHELLGSRVLEEDLRLSRATHMEGEVRGPDGEAVAGARVIVQNVIGTDGFGYAGPGKFETRSGADGRFTIRGLPHGECRLTVWSDGLYQPGGVTTSYDLPRDEPLLITMIGTGSVSGTLKRSGKRQLNVTIHPPGGQVVGSWGGSMHCGEDGSFEFTNVPEGDYLVGPSRGDDLQAGNPGVRKITVKAGETVTVHLED